MIRRIIKALFGSPTKAKSAKPQKPTKEHSTALKAKRIYDMMGSGATIGDTAKAYKVSYQIAHSIKHGRSWSKATGVASK